MIFILYFWFIFINFFTVSQVSNSASTSSSSLSNTFTRKVIVHGPLDNYIVRSLSNEDRKKFHILLIRLTVSCRWALHWVNKPEVKELFEFLKPYLKLPDCKLLGSKILKNAVSEEIRQCKLH